MDKPTALQIMTLCLQRFTCKVFFGSQVFPFRCYPTVVSCAFTTYVCTISPHQVMRHVIAGQKLKEDVEAMRLQLAFMIGFVSSSVGFLKCPYFLILSCGGRNCNQNVAAMFLHAVQQTPLQVSTHNFLKSGHSHMECDFMHSAIEREKRHADAFTLLD